MVWGGKRYTQFFLNLEKKRALQVQNQKITTPVLTSEKGNSCEKDLVESEFIESLSFMQYW